MNKTNKTVFYGRKKVSINDIKFLRPNIGIQTTRLNKILGKKLKKNKNKDQHLFWNDIK